MLKFIFQIYQHNANLKLVFFAFTSDGKKTNVMLNC